MSNCPHFRTYDTGDGLACKDCDWQQRPTLNATLHSIGLGLKKDHGDLTNITSIMGRLSPVVTAMCNCGEADFGDGLHYRTCPKRRPEA